MTELEFTALYQRYAPRLHRVMQSLLARYGIPEAEWSADDASSRIWLEAWEHASSGSPVNWTWLKMTARGRAKNWLRDQSIRPRCVSYDHGASWHTSGDDRGDWVDRAEFKAYWRRGAPERAKIDEPKVKSAILELPLEYQEVLLFRLRGFSNIDIAEFYGVSRESARQLSSRAFRVLREKLAA